MADTSIILNPGVAGASLATYQDSGSVNHERVVLETQSGAGDPVHVNGTNPLPVVQTGTPALPTGAATAVKQPALGSAGAASADVLSVQGIASMTPLLVNGSGVTQPVSGTFFQATQPVSATALPLPTGASTAAKQAAPGTAGAASADVTTVQGVASMTPLLVNGSGVTQPISGNVGQGTPGSGISAWPVKIVEDTTNTSVNAGDATNKAIRVNVVAGAGSGGTAIADGATFTRGTTSETPAGGIAETSAPTLTNGKAAALSLDTSGNLRVVTSGSGGGSSIADGATFTRGTTAETTAGGVVSTSAPTLTAGQAGALSLNTAGGLRVDGSGVTQPVSIAAAVTVAQATAANLNATVTGTVTANAGSGTFAISAASLPLPTGAATNSTVAAMQVAQASTTSGQSGTLMQGAVTTASPTYTTAQTSPLSLDTSGSLRVAIVSGAGSGGTAIADGATFTRGTTSETPTGGVVDASAPTLTAGKAAALSLNTDGTLNVKVSNGISSGTAGAPNSAVLSIQGITSMTPIKTDGSGVTQPVSIAATVAVTDVPATSGGWSKWSTPHDNSNTPLTTKAAVKGSAGQLGGYIIYNPNASVAYVQVFDAATTGAVTLGTTRPDMVIPIPASSGANLEIGKGAAFASGIVVAATTADSNATAPGTGLTCTFLFK